MAAHKGVNITNLDATPRVPASSEQVHGVLRVWYDTYETSSFAVDDTVALARMPAGSTIHDVILKADDLHGSSTLEVGDSDDPNRFISIVSTWNTPGQTQSMLGGSSKIADGTTAAMTGVGYRYTTETDILVKLTGNNAADAKTISMWVYYTTD